MGQHRSLPSANHRILFLVRARAVAGRHCQSWHDKPKEQSLSLKQLIVDKSMSAGTQATYGLLSSRVPAKCKQKTISKQKSKQKISVLLSYYWKNYLTFGTFTSGRMRNGFANGICTTFVESYARIGTITVYTSGSHSTIIIEMTAWFAFTAGIARRIYLTNLTKWAICVTATTWKKIQWNWMIFKKRLLFSAVTFRWKRFIFKSENSRKYANQLSYLNFIAECNFFT